jgi:DNA-binding NtrC family response regulator
MLEKKGYRVRGAATAEEGVAQLEAVPAELVITDLRMPGIGGMKFLRRLKRTWPDTEVVVMTAYGSIDTAVEAMRCGAYDYLAKPIDHALYYAAVGYEQERDRIGGKQKRRKGDEQRIFT